MASQVSSDLRDNQQGNIYENADYHISSADPLKNLQPASFLLLLKLIIHTIKAIIIKYTYK